MKTIPVTMPYTDVEEENAITGAIKSGWVAQGPQVAEFEKKIAKHEGVEYGVATTSCTTALHLAMVSSGLREKMDVIAPAFTFVATTNAIVQAGAIPVLVDIKQDTFNIDVEQLEKLIMTKYTAHDEQIINKQSGNVLWGIVPVHEFGLCCNILEVNKLAAKYHLHVIEDAACALGAQVNGKHIGSFGNPACISFHPRKSITTGEGGMVLTDDEELTVLMRQLRTHGSSISADKRHAGKGFLLPEFDNAGFNYRMTDIQGAMGIAQCKKLDFIINEKRKKAKKYNELIKENIPEFVTPIEPEGYFHTYQSYVCMLDIMKMGLSSVEEGGHFRNQLLSNLETVGIATRQGTHAIHLLGYYRKRFSYEPKDYYNAYACDHLSITLPLYVQMTDEDQKYIIEVIRKTIDGM